MTILFIALLCAGVVLLMLCAAPVSDADLTWSWYAGIGCVAMAVLIAVAHGWLA